MTPPEQIDRLIEGLTDWRGEMLAKVRKTLLSADSQIVETWKWMGSPVWERDGIIAVATVLKQKIKLTFSHGAQLDDPHGLFNNGFGGSQWRAINSAKGHEIDAHALKALVRAAIAFNQAALKKKATAKTIEAKTPSGG